MSELVLWETGALSPPALAEIANREHALALQSGEAMIVHALAAGKALIEAKAGVQHGEWLLWLGANFVASEDTAHNYMKLARNSERVRNLDDPSLRKALNAISTENGRSERDALIKARRAEQIKLAQASIAADPNALRLEQADIHTWRPEGVSAIITDPPYITDNAVELHAELGQFALDVLPDGGALVILTWQPLLPDVMRVLAQPGLIYRWMAAWVFETSARTPERKPRVFDGWKPVLVYHKGHIPTEATYLYDVISSPDSDKTHHEWGQAPEGFMQLVRAFTEPGEVVCDPFLGGGTTAVAALAESRRFIGCDIDEAAVATTRERLN